MLRSKRLNEEEVIGYSNLIVEEGRRLEAMSMKLLELIVLKNRILKCIGLQLRHFSRNCRYCRFIDERAAN